jgi:tetratricopeptide (TPR) repeat protein
MCTTEDPANLPLEALRLVDRLPDRFSNRYGREYIDEVDARSLAATLGIRLLAASDMEDPGHLLIVGREVVLFYRAGLDTDALAHLVLEWVGRHLGGSDVAARIFAFAGRIGAEAVQKGPDWVIGRWRRLRPLGAEWFEAAMNAMPETLEAVRALLAEVNRIVPTMESPARGWTPARAVLQGRVARRRGALDRAEAWAEFALKHAAADPPTTADAINCLARCDYQKGRIGSARKRWLHVVEFAKEHGLLFVEGAAHVNLVSVAMLSHDEEAIQRHTHEASRCFPKGREELAALGQNYARYRMEFGSYAGALPVLTALARWPALLPQVRIAAYAGLARCCAGLGDRSGYEEWWCAAVTVLEMAEEWTPDAHHELGLAAALMGEWDRAERSAWKSLEAAREARDGRAVLQADALLARIERKEGCVCGVDAARPGAWVPDSDASVSLAAALAI